MRPAPGCEPRCAAMCCSTSLGQPPRFALYEQKVQERFAVRQTLIRRRGERLLTAQEIAEKRMTEYQDMARRLAELGYPVPTKTIEVSDERAD